MSQNRGTLPQIVQIVIYAILEIIGSRKSQQTTLIDAMEITHVSESLPFVVEAAVDGILRNRTKTYQFYSKSLSCSCVKTS